MGLNVEHCEQLAAQIRRYLASKGNGNPVFNLLRSALAAIDFLVVEVRKAKP